MRVRSFFSVKNGEKGDKMVSRKAQTAKNIAYYREHVFPEDGFTARHKNAP